MVAAPFVTPAITSETPCPALIAFVTLMVWAVPAGVAAMFTVWETPDVVSVRVPVTAVVLALENVRLMVPAASMPSVAVKLIVYTALFVAV